MGNGESSSGETIEILSPYLHEVIGQVQAITRGEVDEAIASAKEAQKSWAEASLQDRAKYLYKWADELVNMQDEIADIIMKEVGKGYKDAKKEVVRTADFIRYTIEEALHMHGESMMGDSFLAERNLNLQSSNAHHLVLYWQSHHLTTQ